MMEDQQLQQKVQNGFIVESEADMTDSYQQALINQLIVQGDTELMSAPAYIMGGQHAPNTNTMISAVAIVQDELGHANIAYRLLEDLGVDTHWLLYERSPEKFKHPFAFDQPLQDWIELVVANALFDRAGITLLGDVHRNTSYGPLKRALVKVDMEENFHLRHGEVWMRRLAQDEPARERLQQALGWMFPMGVEWFGMSDDRKRHTEQLDFRLKGKSNDELRQTWLQAVVPLCERLELTIPAHTTARETVELEYDFPCRWNPEDRRWLLDEPVSWNQVFQRWKARGPMNQRYVEQLRRSHGSVQHLLGP